MRSIQSYLDYEDFIERTTQEIYDKLGKEKAVKLKAILSKGPSIYKEMYKSLFEIDPVCYDLLKSRQCLRHSN